VRSSPGTRARILLAVIVCTATLFGGTPSALAAPATPQIKSKQAEADAARTQMADLNDDMEMRVEEFNAVTQALRGTRADIEVTRQRFADAAQQLSSAQDRLGERAFGIYVSGEIDLVEVLLGTTSFDDFITRIDLLNRISVSDASLVEEVAAQKAAVEKAQSALQSREEEQSALRQQAQMKRDAVDAALKRQQRFVASLDAEVTRLVKAEEERQRKIAEELARKAAAAAALRKAAARSSAGAPGGAHADAVSVALKYLGVPYVWGGEDPSGFDCSGLTSYVYREIGISIPRTSREQYRVGAFIAASELDKLQPGDLVFFGYGGDPDRVHHVGMYVGDGDFIHAPGTGDRVSVTSLTARITARGDYVGAVRP
jgi:cell wall-associated NlpC family hydrolase